MDLEQATKNYLYYFQATKRPMVWVMGVGFETGQEAARSVYAGRKEWLATDMRLVDVLMGRGDRALPKGMADMVLVDTDAAPIVLLERLLERGRVFVVRTDDGEWVRRACREVELVLVDERELPGGYEQLTWVRSSKRRA